MRAYLAAAGHEVIDLGALQCEPLDDYPDFAEKVGEAIKRGDAPRGILICGSGVGVCVAANKIPGIRAGMCHDTYSAHQGVEHDDMNVLVLGARIIGSALAFELARAFVGAKFMRQRRALSTALQEGTGHRGQVPVRSKAPQALRKRGTACKGNTCTLRRGMPEQRTAFERLHLNESDTPLCALRERPE